MLRSYLNSPGRCCAEEVLHRHQPVRHLPDPRVLMVARPSWITSSRRWRRGAARAHAGISRAHARDRRSWHSIRLPALDRYAPRPAWRRAHGVFSMPQTVYSYQGGQRIKLFLKRTDAGVMARAGFPVPRRRPVHGSGRGNGALVAVVNATTRDASSAATGGGQDVRATACASA